MTKKTILQRVLAHKPDDVSGWSYVIVKYNRIRELREYLPPVTDDYISVHQLFFNKGKTFRGITEAVKTLTADNIKELQDTLRTLKSVLDKASKNEDLIISQEEYNYLCDDQQP